MRRPATTSSRSPAPARCGCLTRGRGRIVLVEKPMATTAAECDRMIAAARASGAVLRIGLVRRFIPAYQLAAEIIAAGTFGALRRITVREGVVYDWPATTGFFLSRR